MAFDRGGKPRHAVIRKPDEPTFLTALDLHLLRGQLQSHRRECFARVLRSELRKRCGHVFFLTLGILCPPNVRIHLRAGERTRARPSGGMRC